MAEIEKETGKNGLCIAAQLDVSDPASVKAFVSEVASAYDQQVYALINNAAVFPHGWTSETFDTAMATNFTGPLDLALGLAPHIMPGTLSRTMPKSCSREETNMAAATLSTLLSQVAGSFMSQVALHSSPTSAQPTGQRSQRRTA